MKILIVSYSLSGNTRIVATALAKELGADIVELRCNRYARGTIGYFRAGFDSWWGNLPQIEPVSRSPSQYDLVVIAGPIWAWHAATPVRVWLTRERNQLPKVAFLLTHGGAGAETSLLELEQITASAPVARLVVREADIKRERFGESIRVFAEKLRAASAT